MFARHCLIHVVSRIPLANICGNIVVEQTVCLNIESVGRSTMFIHLQSPLEL